MSGVVKKQDTKTSLTFFLFLCWQGRSRGPVRWRLLARGGEGGEGGGGAPFGERGAQHLAPVCFSARPALSFGDGARGRRWEGATLLHPPGRGQFARGLPHEAPAWRGAPGPRRDPARQLVPRQRLLRGHAAPGLPPRFPPRRGRRRPRPRALGAPAPRHPRRGAGSDGGARDIVVIGATPGRTVARGAAPVVPSPSRPVVRGAVPL